MTYRLRVHSRDPWKGDYTEGYVTLLIGNYTEMDTAFTRVINERKEAKGERLIQSRFQVIASDGTVLRESKWARYRL
jgi:hypothetical protein